MQEYLHRLDIPIDPITPQLYNDWRTHPCTMLLKSELLTAFLDSAEEDLPESIDRSMCVAHQKEGCRKTLDIIFNWEPADIRRARIEGEEVDHD
jgi:hypothetical protein